MSQRKKDIEQLIEYLNSIFNRVIVMKHKRKTRKPKNSMTIKQKLAECQAHIDDIYSWPDTGKSNFDYRDVKSRFIAFWKQRKDKAAMEIGKVKK